MGRLNPVWLAPVSCSPLIEPDRQISRVRLSENTHASLIRKRVTPFATCEDNLTRFQRASEGAQHSAGGRRNNVVNRSSV